MVNLGRIMFVFGLMLTVVGLIGGFGFMFFSANQALAKIFLISVPMGFLFLFVGLSTVVMFSPRNSDETE